MSDTDLKIGFTICSFALKGTAEGLQYIQTDNNVRHTAQLTNIFVTHFILLVTKNHDDK